MPIKSHLRAAALCASVATVSFLLGVSVGGTADASIPVAHPSTPVRVKADMDPGVRNHSQPDLVDVGQPQRVGVPASLGSPDPLQNEVLRQLLADIQAQVMSGSLDMDEVLATFVPIAIAGRMGANDPLGALGLMRLTGVDPLAEGVWPMSEEVAKALQAQGDAGAAAEALLIGAKQHGMDFQRAFMLAECDPVAGEAVIGSLRAAAAVGSVERGELDQQFAMQLLRNGKVAEGWAILDKHASEASWQPEVSRGMFKVSLYEYLVTLDPAGAAARIQARLGSFGDQRSARLLLVEAAANLGNAALRDVHLHALLSESPYDPRAIAAMDRLTPGASLRYLETKATAEAPASIHAAYADKLREAKRFPEAEAALLRAWKKTPEYYFHDLLRWSPSSADMVGQYARQSDAKPAAAAAMLGAVGRVMWRAGREAEAQRCWQDAVDRDPSSSREWRKYLDACRQNRNPLD